jgi:hypothetical protein
MSSATGDRTNRLLALVPDQAIRARIEALFAEGPGIYREAPSERLKFAIIKLALAGPGTGRRQRQGIDIAEKLYRADWRDLLVSAEFATDLQAHEKWCDSMLKTSDA